MILTELNGSEIKRLLPNRFGSVIEAQIAVDTAHDVEQLGKPVYDTRCAQCHQANGKGIPGSFPSLTQTEWVLGDKGRLVRLLLNGMQGPLEVEGEAYNGIMILPPPALTDEQVAAVLTYVRQHFGNDAEAVTPDEVATVRAANEQEGLWEAAELLERTG